MKRIITLTLSLLLLFGSLSACTQSIETALPKPEKTQLDAKSDNQEEEYTINAPYEYPIKPGTEEWKLITNRIERAEKCQIPEDILSRMTTEALAKTVLEYPFMVDMYAWNTTSVGYQVIKSEFNGLQELEMRPDGLETLQSMSQMRSSDSDGSSLRSRYLDIIISEMTQKDTVLYRDESQLQTRGNLPTTPLGNILAEGKKNTTSVN